MALELPLLNINALEGKKPLELHLYCTNGVPKVQGHLGHLEWSWNPLSLAANPEGAQEYTLLQEYYFCGTPTEKV